MFGKGDELAVDTEWRRGDPLQALVDSTAPEFGEVEELDPTDEQVLGLLANIKRQAPFLTGEALPGIILGAIGVVVVGVLLGLLSHALGVECAPDSVKQAVISGVGGGFLGSIVGGLLWARRGAKTQGRVSLSHAIRKHKLDTGQVARVIDRNPSMPGWMRAAASGGATK